ncbi:MAG: putative type I restriction enzymeP M protein [Anaerolineae bacterium]|nr:putative type I restriction enzymeP M protein [Anaerolineae bacterium]
MATPNNNLDFETELWQTAVNLRGTVAPAEYKSYVLPLVFMRYLSLRYEQRYTQLKMELKEPRSPYYTGDPEMDQFFLTDPSEYTKHNVLLVPAEARWSYLRQHAYADDIKIKLDAALRALEEHNPRLANLLPPLYARSNLTVDQVAGLINLFSKDKFERPDGSDLLGRAYMYFIANFASTEGNRGGEFFTPLSIVRLLVEMLAPRQGVVFDPAAGSGGMFIQAEAFTHNRHSLSFYGQESIETTLRLGKMNLLMHGLDGDIKLGNSLLNDQFPALRADTIITNPPFNLRWDADKLDDKDARLNIGYQKGQVTAGNANYMWLMHYLYHLADGGTAGTVMANGAMTTNQTAEKQTRTALIEEGYIDCIVQLPDKLFPSTGIPCCLFFLSKNRSGTHGRRARREEILFIDARQLGQMLNRRQRQLTAAEIGRIAAAYHAYRSPGEALPDEAGFCRVAPLAEVRQHDYKLTPGIYVGTQADDADDEPYEEKMPRLTDELRDLFTQSDELQAAILADLEGLV